MHFQFRIKVHTDESETKSKPLHIAKPLTLSNTSAEEFIKPL